MTFSHNEIQNIKPDLAASLSQESIQSRIYTIRGVQVMLDRDLAILYGVETKQLNQAVKRNPIRFPEDFMFQLTKEESYTLKSQFPPFENSSVSEKCAEDSLRSQNVTTNKRGGSRYLPYVFTEQGVGQLSSILRSENAALISVKIQRAFVAMRRFIIANAGLLQRVDSLETFRIETKHELENIGQRFDDILRRLDDGSLKSKMGVFFDGQMFDAFALVEEIVKKSNRRICLIDDYVDADVLQRFRHRNLDATVDCYVNQRHITSAMRQAFSQYNAQYPAEHVELHTFNHSHDRWLVVDDTVYHFGASIKDLGKKWFSVDIVTEHTADELIARITI